MPPALPPPDSSWTGDVFIFDARNTAFVRGERATLSPPRLSWDVVLYLGGVVLGLMIFAHLISQVIALPDHSLPTLVQYLTTDPNYVPVGGDPRPVAPSFELLMAGVVLLAGGAGLVSSLRLWRRWLKMRRSWELVPGVVTGVGTVIESASGYRYQKVRAYDVPITITFQSPLTGKRLITIRTVPMGSAAGVPPLGQKVAVFHGSDTEFDVL